MTAPSHTLVWMREIPGHASSGELWELITADSQGMLIECQVVRSKDLETYEQP